jgi:hypothetical protein
LHVVRDPGAAMPLEVRLRAANLPDLVVELPAGVPEVLAPIRGELAGAQYDVVDASPFASACSGEAGGCVRAETR